MQRKKNFVHINRMIFNILENMNAHTGEHTLLQKPFQDREIAKETNSFEEIVVGTSIEIADLENHSL